MAKGRLDGVSINFANQGRLQGSGVTLKSDTLRNSGTLQSAAALMLEGNVLDQQGTLGATGDATLTLRDRISNARDGQILTDGALTVTAGEMLQNGVLSARSGLVVSGDSLSSGNGALTTSKGNVTLKARNRTDISGDVNADGVLSVTSDTVRTAATAHLQGKNLDLRAGQVELNGTQAEKQQLQVSANELAHKGKSSADRIILNAVGMLNNSGSLLADSQLQATAAQLTNSATGSADNIILNATGTINNSGALAAKTQLQANAAALNNSGTLSAPRLAVKSETIDNSGLLRGAQNLTVSGHRLNNQQSGSIATTGDLALDLPDFTNGGLLSSGGALQLSGNSLTSSGEINAASIRSNNSLFTHLAGGKLLTMGALQMANGRLNNDGQIAAGQLDVNTDVVNNGGRLQGDDSLNLDSAALTNRNGGELLTGGQLTLNSGELENNGLLQGDRLALTAGNWRNGGNALSAGDAKLVALSLSNSGKILGQQKVQLQTDKTVNAGWLVARVVALQGDLTNSGLIQGSDALALTGKNLSNQSAARLHTAGALDINATVVDNQGSLQADSLNVTAQSWQNSGNAHATKTVTAATLNQLNNSGTLLSQQAMDLQAADVVNSGTLAADLLTINTPQVNNSGLLQGNSALALNSAQIVNQANGRLISGGALTLAPDQLTNDGLLQVVDGLNISGRDVNNNGQVTARELRTSLSGTLHNGSSGKLLARQLVQIEVQSLNNAGIVAGEQLKASGNTLQNRGLLQGDGTLSANFRQLDNLSGGQLLTGGELVLRGTGASNDGVWQGDRLSYQFDSLKNQGTINGSGGLDGDVVTLLDNSGKLISGGNASLSAGSLLNSGNIMANGLVLRGDVLNNSGLWQGSTLLDARATGGLTQSSGGKALSGGDLLLNASGLNTSGTLQGVRAHISAASWQHQGSLLGSDGLTANISGELNNQGALLSQSAAQISAQKLVNNGSLLAEKAIILSGNALNNSGTVQGDTLVITPASVTNQGSLIGLKSLTLGAVPQVNGFRMPMKLAAPTRELVNNAGGQLLTQGTLDIQANTVTNNGSWQGQQILLQASRLANGGEIVGVNGLNVLLNGALSQQQDKTLLSAGKLSVQAASVNNSGRIQGGELDITSGAIDNSGRLQGDNSLLLTTNGRMTNNGSGSLITRNAITLTTPELLNDGLMQSDSGNINATGLATNNGKLLADGELTFSTPQLINNGWLQAAQLTLNATNANNNGTLLADRQGTLTGVQLQNQGTAQGGNLAVNYQQLTNSGIVLGVNQLNVKAAQVNQQAVGKLFSGGSLLLESDGFDQLGQVVALGDATLNLVNSFVGRNTLAAGNRLSIRSNGTLENQGTMQGQALTLSAVGDLVNNGQFTSGTGDSSLSGRNITMNASGSLQGGGNVNLISQSDVTLNGFTGTRGNLTISTPGSLVNTALLYAGQNLSLLANSIYNQRGDILAGNSLWMQRDAAGNANSEVMNTSGTIETQNGDITIRTANLLNQRDGLSIDQTTQKVPGLPEGIGEASLIYNSNQMSSDDLGYYSRTVNCCGSPGKGNGHEVTSYYLAPNLSGAVKRFLTETTTLTARADGGSARIAAGRNLDVAAGQLNNLASNLLATHAISLKGDKLNNQSWFSGVNSTYLTYKYDGTIASSGFDERHSREDFSPYTGKQFTYRLASAPEYETTLSGESLRAVIQAGDNINASFSGDISNTAATPNAGWSGNTLSTPALSGLAAVSQVGVHQRQQFVDPDKVAVNSPQWKDRLQSALQQINGGGALDKSNLTNVALAGHSANPEGRTDLGKAGDQITDPSVNAMSINHYQAASIDTSAYPLPAGDNGYFVASTDNKSPYLFTINPKLNGLGQLDASLYGNLNALLGKQPGHAVQETRQQYTDQTAFLGSAYLLGRLNFKPEYDYRFLGDAAFDTRYVSNIVLNQTGSRYLNGIGSELDQMRYLMDNAAAARQALGLQFGVSLTAQQIAALDKSVIWWEAATVNGETVMIPKVYLSSKDVELRDGSVIAGNNVTLSGANITNSGSTLTAKKDLTVNGQNSISNLNAGLMHAGGDLQLSALNNINNVSSTISGKKVALESVNGDISNTTETKLWQLDGTAKRESVSANQTYAGPTASVMALDSLSLKAGNDIAIIGANLNAGGNLLLDAWHDIAISSNQMTSGYAQSGSNVDWRGGQSSSNQSVTNTASQVSSGNNLSIHSGHDLSVMASNINAVNDASLSAGNDLNLNSATHSQSSAQGNKESHSTGLDRSSVSSGGNLNLAAGQDINSQAAAIAASGNVGLKAARDINLDAKAIGSGYSEKGSQKTIISETVRQQGTEIASGGSTSLIAGRDINSGASDVTAKQDIALQAGRDVNLNTATESDYFYKEETKTKKGFLSKKTSHTIQEDSSTAEKGTQLSGNNVSVSAGNDLLVKGSQVVGDGKVALNAGNNVDISAATNTDSSWRLSETKRSGLMGTGGLGVSFGSSKSLNEMRDKGTTQSQSVSTVGSTGGDVSVTAGRQLQVNGAVAEAVNSAIATAQSAKQESHGRLAALQATKAVLAGVQANQASQLAQASGDPNNGIGISVSLTTQQSTSQQHQSSDTVSGSTINAGQNLSIDATGKGNGVNSGDLLVAGSQLKAGGDTALHAANDMMLTGAASTQQITGKNSSSGGGVGLSFGVGQGSAGVSIFASVNGAKGHEKGNGTVWSETTLDSGGNVSISSGRDTTLSGAQVNGKGVTADIGRNLTLSSLQDSDTYDSKQASFGAGGSFTFGSMTGSGYVNASQDKMHSNYDSVLEQSGIYAGKSGFDIAVGNHTQLNGAVIASQAKADKNRLDTGTLGFSDIHNEADYNVEHQGTSISSSGSMGGQFVGNMANTMLAGAGGTGHAEGTTQ